MFENELKKKLKEGKAAIGTFIVCNAPDLVEIAGLAGFDFVIIDNEHGPMRAESTQHMIRAAELRGITPIVRIPDRLESTILHTLDIGAHGIQVPQVNNARAAKEIIERSKYEPMGKRGLAFPKSADYGMSGILNFTGHSNEQTLIITHCENKTCLENLEEICKIPEIDVIFLGPYDMSQSMGVTGQVTHELVENAANKVIELTKKYNKIAGVFAGNGEAAKKRAEQGFQYIAMGMDTTLYSAKCVEEINKFNS
ncbi:aldolase/citrate lyase family protein [Sedimentibacter sp.]|uniref:HpcH/HpaI aldolase family protein n=1 Tax=Sedimentibacter sp. TaxID=1960295 RepID=UPI0028AE70D9|nr:aldolase/citrate lyase family protein [Sedimentibacter sp.]